MATTYTNSINYQPTNHGIVVGGANSTISSVGPDSTTGKVLQSQGSSADPAFSTATYPNTAGTSGNLLTSDGTNWNSTAPTGLFPSPATTLTIYDDFFNANLWNPTNWTPTGPASNAHPGVVKNSSVTAGSTGSLNLNNGSSNIGGIVPGGGAITFIWIFNIASLSVSQYDFSCGLNDGISLTPTNGIWVRYLDTSNSGQWIFNTSSGGTPTNSNSSTAVTTGWHTLQVTVNAAASSVSFTMDGVSLGTAITNNIPTTSIYPFIAMKSVSGTNAGAIGVDLFYLTQSLTSARF